VSPEFISYSLNFFIFLWFRDADRMREKQRLAQEKLEKKEAEEAAAKAAHKGAVVKQNIDLSSGGGQDSKSLAKALKQQTHGKT
jgi:hypothetical protein